VVFGAYEPQTATFFLECAAAAYVAPKQKRPGGRMRGPSIASCLLRRNLWRAVGGFPDLRAAQDLIFMERCQQVGKIAWTSLALVRRQLQPSLVATFRRFAIYSYHNVLAGRQRHWHYGIARQYFIGSGLLVAERVPHGPRLPGDSGAVEFDGERSLEKAVAEEVKVRSL
jgi:hypothetical protein